MTIRMEHTEYINYLTQFVSETRRAKFDQVLKFRSRHITVVLEDLYQPHNASAVLRSCDIFGIQDIHIIENKNAYTVNKDIALGAPKWLDLHKYRKAENNSLECILKLKEQGYRIVATTPHEKDCDLADLSIDKPLALFFGTELTGISDTVREHADEYVKIPMYGFTESFNISVSAALCLHTLKEKLHHSTVDWHLNEEEKEELLLKWLRNSIPKVELIEKDYIAKRSIG
ncbi:MAG: RNA methyltransferase [Bacteroidetes bacterium]|nr:RNA methyltransferase [Bacteroidota bacterium]